MLLLFFTDSQQNRNELAHPLPDSAFFISPLPWFLFSTNVLRISMKQFFSIFRNYAHLLLILPVLFICLHSPQPAGAELVDKIVAVVNDDVITLSEVEEASVELSGLPGLRFFSSKIRDLSF